MHHHAPLNYVCPICLAIDGVDDERTWIRQQDIVYRDELVVVFIGSKFIPGHEGYPLVVPARHFENIYDLPDVYAHRIAAVTRKVALAVRNTYGCDGITITQNNEPAGDQHAFHYHTHVQPRFIGDQFYEHLKANYRSEEEARIPFAERLREALLS